MWFCLWKAWIRNTRAESTICAPCTDPSRRTKGRHSPVSAAAVAGGMPSVMQQSRRQLSSISTARPPRRLQCSYRIENIIQGGGYLFKAYARIGIRHLFQLYVCAFATGAGSGWFSIYNSFSSRKKNFNYKVSIIKKYLMWA